MGRADTADKTITPESLGIEALLALYAYCQAKVTVA
jgi:hypothetical protein